MTSHGSSEPIIDHLWGLPGLPRQKMDLSHLPENERNYMMKLIEEKQAKQFMNLYNTIVSKCFEGCVTDFTSDTPSAAEKGCLKRCTQKFLKMTNRVGQQMAEKQMMPPSS